MELHAAGEDYLETVLLLEQEKQMVYSVDLAKRMGVTRASVSRAVGILCDGGFLCVEGRVLRLTEKGRSMAQQVHEKQMFFERWLMQAGVAPACARADACRIKHAVSEESYVRLRAAGQKGRGRQMLNKRLLGIVPGCKRYIVQNVALQWCALAANIAMIFTLGLFLQALLRGGAQAGVFWGTAAVMAAAATVRFACTKGAARAAFYASKEVKKTLRGLIYRKLLRLGAAYTQSVPTAEVVQLAGEGTEQLETYFGAYLPQLFYSMLAPVTLFAVLCTVSVRAAVVLMVCVPLIPVSIVAVQKFAKRLLGRYWGQYAALGDHFLENLQGLTTLKIYGADEDRHRQMNRDAEHFRRVTMKVLTMQLNSIIVMDVIAYGGAALGIIVAAGEFAAGRTGFAGCFAIVLLSADFFLPLRALGSYFHVAMNGMAASGKIFRLLDLPEAPERTAAPGAQGGICCEGPALFLQRRARGAVRRKYGLCAARAVFHRGGVRLRQIYRGGCAAGAQYRLSGQRDGGRAPSFGTSMRLP